MEEKPQTGAGSGGGREVGGGVSRSLSKRREQSFASEEAELSTEEDDQRLSQEKTNMAIR